MSLSGLSGLTGLSAICGQVHLPAGAVGVWYADTYVSSPRAAVPNAMTATALSANLLAFPRRRFADNNYYGRQNITATDSNATAPDGSSDASTLIGTGDCYIFTISPHPVLPAGTYTVAAWVKRSGGSDSQFTMQFFTAGLVSPTKTATSSWQRFSFTATVGAGAQTMFFARSVGGAGFSLEICDVALYAGAADLGEPGPVGHMYLGLNQYGTLPTYSSGSLDFSNGSLGTLQLPSTSLSSFTLLAVARRVANVNTYGSPLSNASAYNPFSPMFDQANTAKLYFGGIDIASGGLTGAWSLYNRGWKIHGYRWDGTTASIFVNNSRVMHQTGYSPAAVTLKDLVAGVFQQSSNPGDYQIAAMALYTRALTEAEMAQGYAALKRRVASSGNNLTENDVYYRAEGDSITSDENSYCLKYGPNATINVLGARSAVAGGVIAGIAARASTIIAGLPASKGSRTYIVSILIGANDLTGPATVNQFLADYAAVCDTLRAAGIKVVVCTILPNTNSGFNTKRNSANTELRLWTTGGSVVAGVHADAICDFAANATMGPDAAASNATYYPDGVHPSDAGHVILETVLRPVLNSM